MSGYRRRSLAAIMLLLVFAALSGCSDAIYYVYSKFHGNGGLTAEQKDSFTEKHEDVDSWYLPDNPFIREGYTFVGWRKYSNGPAVAPGTRHKTSNDEDWNAIWSPNLTLDPNGGAGTMATQTTSPIAANTYTRSGYSFSGWNTKADGTGTAYADQAPIEFTAPTTLYAQWHAVTAPGDSSPVNPAAVYHLDNDLVESSGHNRTALKVGMESLFTTSGKLSHGVTGPAVSDFIYFPGDYSLAADYSVAMWVKTTATSGWLIAKQGSNGVDGHGYRYELKLTIMPSGKAVAELGSATAWAMSTLPSNQVINDGDWHFVCLVVQGSTLSLYIDRNAPSTTAVSVPRLPASTAAIILGGNANSTSATPTALSATGLFVGTIDEIRIYDKALSAAEVAALY